MFNAIIEVIEKADPLRSVATLPRRLIKILEELGEISEAYLNVTSAKNGKNKTWVDVREEAIDVLIIATDCLLTPIPSDWIEHWEWQTKTYKHRSSIVIWMESGVGQRVLTHTEIMSGCFIIAKNVAEAPMFTNSPKDFYYRMHLIVEQAVGIVYGGYDGDERPVAAIHKEVLEILHRKIDKWTSGHSTAVETPE